MDPLQFLLLEDSSLDAELIYATLVEGGIHCKLMRVETRSEFLSALEQTPVDLILADYSLPTFDGIAALDIARSRCPDVPFVFVSATLGEELAVEMLKNGAIDYVLKQRLGRLVPAVQRALRETEERRERQRAEALLRESEDRYRRLFERNPQPMWVFDAKTLAFLSVNQAAIDHYGYSESEFLSMTIQDIRPSEDVPVLTRIFSSLPEDADYKGVWKHQKKDGTLIDVEVSTRGETFAGRPARLVLINDITEQQAALRERQQAEERLRESERRFRQFAENIEDVLWILNRREQTMLYISPAYEHIWGRSCESLYANIAEWTEAIHPQDRDRICAVFLNQVLEEGYELEYRVLRPDGSVRWIRDRAFPIKNEPEGACWAAGIAEDITERKRIEAEREEWFTREQAARESAEAANRIKDEFLAVLSHELRSPLNPILGWAKLLRSRTFDPATTAHALEIIERNARLQTQLIEDLLDVSRILQGKLSLSVYPVDLVSTIAAAIETVRLSAEVKSIQIHTTFIPHNGHVLGDSNRLQQVFWNLLSNAIKFTPPGGQVEVRLESCEVPVMNAERSDSTQPATPATSPFRRYAQITVTDSGKGISPDFLPHVFAYFRQADSATTRKFGGLGLGLAIVRHLIELHGGTVAASSAGEDQGATFIVRLPLTVNTLEQAQERQDSPETLSLQGVRVLVVDDEPDAREFAAFVLQQYDAEVVVVASAKEALEVLTQSVPDLLLSDIGMPDVDGYMLIRQIRQRSTEAGGQIPAIALTAYAAEFDQQQAKTAGFQMHIAKPVEPEAMVNAIARLVQLKRT
ncbi:response regulator [Oculatella sp. LEGE 06141]